MKDVNQVYELAQMHDEYVVNGMWDGNDSDTHGWVKATVSDFTINEDDERLVMHVDMPWGETHEYAWSEDEIVGGPLSKVCDSYGYQQSEFERLQGKPIWLKLRSVETDDDGEVETKTRLTYVASKDGPRYFQKRAAKKIAISVATAVIFLVVIALV